jgi:hypothetical protein
LSFPVTLTLTLSLGERGLEVGALSSPRPEGEGLGEEGY